MHETAVSDMDDLRRSLVGLLPKLRRFAMTLARDAADADALVLQACERAIAKSPMHEGEARLDEWIYTLTRTLWAEEARKRPPRATQASHDPASRERISAAHPLHETILSMPEGLASVFVLVNVEGRSYGEAAGILGIPVATVTARLSAARLKMAMIVAEEEARRA